MASDLVRDYFSLAPASATAFFPYTVRAQPQQYPVTSSCDIHHHPPPQQVRVHARHQQHPSGSSNGVHRPPNARYGGSVTTPQYVDSTNLHPPQTHAIHRLPPARYTGPVPTHWFISASPNHLQPQARYVGPATEMQHDGYLSAPPHRHPEGYYNGPAPGEWGTHQQYPPQYRAPASANNPIDLAESRQLSPMSANAVLSHHYYQQQQQQNQGFGATHNVDSSSSELSELLNSSIHAIDAFNALLQRHVRSSQTATRMGNSEDLARLLRSSIHTVSTFNTLMQQHFLNSDEVAASANDSTRPSEFQQPRTQRRHGESQHSRGQRAGMAVTRGNSGTDFATIIKPSALEFNGMAQALQLRAEVTTTSVDNQVEPAASLSMNNPAVDLLLRRLRDSNLRLRSPDGLCIIQSCESRARSRGLCKRHGGGVRRTADGCTRAGQSGSGRGSLCFRHGDDLRYSQEGCGKKAGQARGFCQSHSGEAHCQAEGCDESSQGNGFYLQHGVSHRCSHEECDEGAQRGGFCASRGGAMHETAAKALLVSSGDTLSDQLATLSDDEPESANDQVTSPSAEEPESVNDQGVSDADEDLESSTAQASPSAAKPAQ